MAFRTVPPPTRQWLRRLLQPLLALILAGWLLLICLQLINRTHVFVNASQLTVAQTLSDHLAAQATPLMHEENVNALQQLVDAFDDDDIIHDVVIYGAQGEMLAHSDNVISIASLYQLAAETTEAGQNTPDARGLTPYVATLWDQGEPIGYVRIAVRSPELLALSERYLDDGAAALIRLLAGTLIIGLLLSRALFHKRYRWQRGIWWRAPKRQ